MFRKNKLLACFVVCSGFASLASVPGVMTANNVKHDDKKFKKFKRHFAKKHHHDNKVTKTNQLDSYKLLLSKVELDTGFKMSSAYVHRFDPMYCRSVLFNDLNNKPTGANKVGDFDTSKVFMGQKPNYPERFMAPEIEAKLGVKWSQKFSRGSLRLKGKVKHEQVDNGNDQFEPKISIDQAYFNIGPKDKWNVELGKCYGPAATAFTDSKVFFRGFSEGVLSHGSRELSYTNTKRKSYQVSDSKSYLSPVLITDSKDSLNPYWEDANNVANPYSRYFFTEDIAGDDGKDQPKITIYSPVVNRGKISARMGVGSTLTTNAQDAIFLSTGGYVDRLLGNNATIRLSAAAGISTQTSSRLEYGRPMGFALGLAYLSRAIDVAYRTGYNGKSYNFNRSAGDLDVIDYSSQDSASLSIKQSFKNWSYDADKARGPWINSLKCRVDLGNDRDLTLGGYYSLRGTGFSDQAGTNHKEHVFGCSIGFNMPIPNVPFRVGAELTYAKVTNEAQLMEYRFTKMEANQILMFGIGVNYAPVVDLDEGERLDDLTKPFRHDTSAYSIE